MAKPITNELVRVAFRSFGNGGQQISNAQIFKALEAENEQEKGRIRTRITEMIQTGEVVKISCALYTYNFKHKVRDASSAKGYTKIWRFVRQQKADWSIKECSLLTGQNNTHVSRYVNWLESQGYLTITGKGENNSRTYRATQQARQTPETPVAPHTDKDPFEKERVAGAKIVRLLLCNDLYSNTTAREISEACDVLLSRFVKNSNIMNENKEDENA